MPKHVKKNSFNLTKREQRFAEIYFSTFSRYKAAAAVTESEADKDIDNLASVLLRKKEVQNYLVYLQESFVNTMVVDRNKLLNETQRLYEELIFKGKTADALKCLDMIAKLTGSYTTEVNVHHDHIITTQWGVALPNPLIDENNLLDEGDDDLE